MTRDADPCGLPLADPRADTRSAPSMVTVAAAAYSGSDPALWLTEAGFGGSPGVALALVRDAPDCSEALAPGGMVSWLPRPPHLASSNE